MKRLLSLLFFLIYVCTVQAQWQQTNGPYVPIIELLSAKNNKIIAAPYVRSGCPYISLDAGNHWSPREKGLPQNI